MAKETRLTEQEWHRRTAATLFNSVWALIDKRRRSREDDDRMVHMAHASVYHWGEVGTPTNLAIGEWQVSHVYAVLKRPVPATHHARRCLEVCEANDLGDFPLAFAYEALARADALAGRKRNLRAHLTQAYEAGEAIAEKEDRDEFFRQLKTVAEVRPVRT